MSNQTPVAALQHDEIELFSMLRSVATQPCMIDVGAHHGLTLAPFLEAGWNVHAFEPIEANREELLRRFPHGEKLVVRSEAVSHSSGTASLHLAYQPDGTLHEFYHTLEQVPEDDWHTKGDMLEVPTVSLDDLVESGEIPKRIGFLKVDTEGHDDAVLAGASHLECEIICVEFWCPGHTFGESPSPPETMIERLRERGYHDFIVVAHQGDSIFQLWSTLQGLPHNAWGNIIFFHQSTGLAFRNVKTQLMRSGKRSEGQEIERLLPHVLRAAVPSSEKLTFIDVGAYKGDFTADLLEKYPDARALLLEPTPETFEEVRSRFEDRPEIRVLDLAAGEREETRRFYQAEKAYNNSLLSPLRGLTRSHEVKATTLDQLRETCFPGQRIHLLKIDTQGLDLQVLRGARATLREEQPVVYIEVTFIPMYEGQCSFLEILGFMSGEGYELAGFVDPHVTRNRLAAYTDCIFVPKSLHQQLSGEEPAEYFCQTADHLIYMNEVLQTAGEERLKLLNETRATCEERLELANSIKKAAEDRLALIHRLNDEIRALQAQLSETIAPPSPPEPPRDRSLLRRLKRGLRYLSPKRFRARSK